MYIPRIALMSIGLLGAVAAKGGEVFIPADDPRLHYSDYAMMEFIPGQAPDEGRTARFRRPLNNAAGYGHNNPAARLRFRTASPSVKVELYYNELHVSKTARNPLGIYLVDGKDSPEWTFRGQARGIVRKTERLSVPLKVPGDGKAHDYELLMPYGDAVDVLGITIAAGHGLETPPPRPAFTCVMYGDSVTHGFTAASVAGSYAFKTAQLKNWQLINMGIGGRSSTADDGTVLGKMRGDMLTVLIGVNDWQGGRDPEIFRRNLTGFIANFRKLKPNTPVCMISPLWVPPEWKPTKATFPLQQYRQIVREVVAASNDPNIIFVDGTELIDHDKKYFDKVAVHPNDEGFAMMAQRLAARLP